MNWTPLIQEAVVALNNIAHELAQANRLKEIELELQTSALFRDANRTRTEFLAAIEEVMG